MGRNRSRAKKANMATSLLSESVEIGQGIFGKVYKAQEMYGKFVVLKRVPMKNHKFLNVNQQELENIHKLMKHENIVDLIAMHNLPPSNSNPFIYLVMEYCDHSLFSMLHYFELIEDIKCVVQQIFRGLQFIHEKNIVHGDLKTRSVLITNTGLIKLGDVGLARALSVSAQENKKWHYSAPEILLGDESHGPKIDLWAAGCIMAEMWIKCAILQGKSKEHQLVRIITLCGSITQEVWPTVETLTGFNQLQQLRDKKQRRVVERLSRFVEDYYACDLMDKLLTLDPEQRIDSNAALQHYFFEKKPTASVNVSDVVVKYQFESSGESLSHKDTSDPGNKTSTSTSDQGKLLPQNKKAKNKK